MTVKKIRSRILENFSPQLLEELSKLCNNPVISDNNIKVNGMLALLDKYKVDYVELGPGTNRLAILIDSYVYKIALDKWGVQDNINEFTISQELQPYVIKTYETNDLIAVSEYVTVISREEFLENKDVIRNVLGIIAEGYLLGDVGSVGKNFCNWGYRDNGDLVILDFAYIYRVQGEELLCSYDQTPLDYDDNFHNLHCPKCNKKYTFMDIRRKIPMEVEKKENFIAKQLAYKLTKPLQEFKDGYINGEDETASSREIDSSNSSPIYNKTKEKLSEDNTKEDKTMPKDYYDRRNDRYISPEERDDAYLRMLEKLQQKNEEDEIAELLDIDEDDIQEERAEALEIIKETPDSTTMIRVIHKGHHDEDDTEDFFDEVANDIREAKEAVIEAEEQVEEDEFVESISQDIQETFTERVEQMREEAQEEETEAEEVEAELVEKEEGYDPNMHIHVENVEIEIDEDGDVLLAAENLQIENPTPQFKEAFAETMVENPVEAAEQALEETTDNKPLYETLERDDKGRFKPKKKRKKSKNQQNETNNGEDVNPDQLTLDDITSEEVVEVEDETIVASETIEVSDDIKVTTTVEVDADALRKELGEDVDSDDDMDIVDEEKFEELAEEYRHLEDEAEEEAANQKRNKNWK